MFLISRRSEFVIAQADQKNMFIPITLVNFSLSLSASRIDLDLTSLPHTKEDYFVERKIIERITYESDTTIACKIISACSESNFPYQMTSDAAIPYSKFSLARSKNDFIITIPPTPYFKGCIVLSGNTDIKTIRMTVFDIYGNNMYSSHFTMKGECDHSILSEFLETKLRSGNYFMTIQYHLDKDSLIAEHRFR